MIRRRIGWYWAIFDNTPALKPIHHAFGSSIPAKSSAFAVFSWMIQQKATVLSKKSLDDWAIYLNGEDFYWKIQAFCSNVQAQKHNDGKNNSENRAWSRNDGENKPDGQAFAGTLKLFSEMPRLKIATIRQNESANVWSACRVTLRVANLKPRKQYAMHTHVA